MVPFRQEAYSSPPEAYQFNVNIMRIFITNDTNTDTASGKRGFTLIEVLVVIGIIAILAAMVLVAVNPARQFKLARDAQRTSDVNAMLNAIHENVSEHAGTFTCGGSARILPTAPTRIKGVIGDNYASGNDGDIASCLVPDYIAAMPYDPGAAAAHYDGLGDYDTAYVIYQNADGRVTASSTGELKNSISATR